MVLKITLLIHIIAGFSALLSGCMAMVVRKGGKAHWIAGKIFFFSMLSVSISAVVVAVIKDLRFLLMIGLFSLYLNHTGYRAVRNKSLQPNLADWLVLAVGVANGVFMLISRNMVLMVFGFIAAYLIAGQTKIYLKKIRRREIPKMQWLRLHIGMMTGAYIAALTAFLVVNVKTFQPNWLPWLAPTCLLVPLIVYWTKKFTRQPKKMILEEL